MERYANIVRAILSRPWAIDPDSLAWAAMLDVIALREAGHILSEDEIQARIDAAQNGPRQGAQRTGKGQVVAVIPVYGMISPRQNLMSRTSGGTTAEDISANFRAAVADPDVDGIVFDIDSPGGHVEGIAELAAEIRASRGAKPIAGHANHMAASAAYWLLSQMDEVAVTPSGSVGSIGVFTAHQDLSAAAEREGIKTTLISAGKYKTEGNKFEPLAEESLAAIQKDVNAYYDMFVGDVSKGRRVSVKSVTAGYGEGRMLLAKNALEAGMVDRIGTLEDTIRRVARGAVGTSSAVAALGDDVLWGTTHIDAPAALGSGLPFAERLSLVSAEAAALARHAEERAELRAEEGRDLSDATRAGLKGLAGSLSAIAEPKPPAPSVHRSLVPRHAAEAYGRGYPIPVKEPVSG